MILFTTGLMIPSTVVSFISSFTKCSTGGLIGIDNRYNHNCSTVGGNSTGGGTTADNINASLAIPFAFLGVFYANWASRKYEKQKEQMASWGDVENMSLSDFENAFGDEAKNVMRLGWKGCCGCSNPRHGACVGAWDRPITEGEFTEVKEAVRLLQGKPKMWKMVMLPFLSMFYVFMAWLMTILLKIMIGFGGVVPFGDFILNSFLIPILIGWGQLLATIIVLYFLKLYVCKQCCRRKTDDEALLQDPAGSYIPPTHGGEAGLGEQTMTRDPTQEAEGEV